MRHLLSMMGLVCLTACATAPMDDGDPAERAPAPELKTGVSGIETAAGAWWADTNEYPHSPKNLAHWARYQWRNQLNISKHDSVTLVDEVKRRGGTLHNWDEGNGYTVTDFHAVELRLPSNDSRRTAAALLKLMRDDPASVGGGPGTTDFSDEVGWPAVQPGKTRQAGDVIFLDLWGPDNAAIAYIDVDIADQQYCVMTATHAQTGWHPVNGIRCWGYIEWTRDGHTHLFYTVGVDSTSVAGSGWVGGSLQFEVWNAQMVAIARQAECLWGRQAGKIWQDDEVQQGLPATPGDIEISDVDHLGEWDAVSDASGQYEVACPNGPLDAWDAESGAESRDTDGDGIFDDKDLCSDTPAGAEVWKSGEWIGCASGQRRD